VEEAEDARLELEARVGVEFDSNVGLTNGLLDEIITERSDVRAVFLAGISGVLYENRRSRLSAGWEMFQSAHQDLHAFDIHDQRVWLAVEHEPRVLRNVLLGLRASYDYYLLDEEDFLSEIILAPTATIGLFELGETEVGYRWQHRTFYLSPFDGRSIVPEGGATANRDADIHNAILRQYVDLSDDLWGWAGYSFVLHDAVENDIASQAFAYTGHVLEGGLNWDLTLPVLGQFSLLAAVEYRAERYDDASAATQVDEDSIARGRRRADDELAVWLGADRDLTSWLRARVGWFGVFNQSEDARFDYDRQVVSAVLEATY
jgi:hypothetical protein